MRKLIIGLTGGIASGKSTVTKMFREKGLKVLDADEVAKDISREKKVVDEIALQFGRDILQEDGSLDRKQLKETVFKNEKKLKILNNIIHPKVIEKFQKEAESTKWNEIKIFDVPLLFEAKMENLCDIIIVVYLNEKKQLERVMQRDNISCELAEKIISSQMPLSEKADRADLIIDNSKDLENLKKEFERVYSLLLEIKEKGCQIER